MRPVTRVMVPAALRTLCERTPERREWMQQLPVYVAELFDRWSLTASGNPDVADGTCSWVAPVETASGTQAVLKLGMPHMEAEHEIKGLHFWNGDPTVRIIDADSAMNALLLERCEPGSSLRTEAESVQDVVVAALLRRMWRCPDASWKFRSLSTMIAQWTEHTMADRNKWIDVGLVQQGLALFDALGQSTTDAVLLATDLHAGNVLRARREPWLVIDPKPFVGDRAYDATQHLLNCDARLRADPDRLIRGFSDQLETDSERVRLWLFARVAADPRDNWGDERLLSLARMLPE